MTAGARGQAGRQPYAYLAFQAELRIVAASDTGVTSMHRAGIERAGAGERDAKRGLHGWRSGADLPTHRRTAAGGRYQRPRRLLHGVGVVEGLRPEGLGYGFNGGPPAISALAQLGKKPGAIGDLNWSQRHEAADGS